MKFPSAGHPIEFKRHPGLVTAFVGDVVLAESRHALLLREAALSPLFYFPREDVAMTLLERSDLASHCPYKGEACYFDAPQLGEGHGRMAWSYEAPHPAMADLRDYIAFTPDLVSMEIRPLT